MLSDPQQHTVVFSRLGVQRTRGSCQTGARSSSGGGLKTGSKYPILGNCFMCFGDRGITSLIIILDWRLSSTLNSFLSIFPSVFFQWSSWLSPFLLSLLHQFDGAGTFPRHFGTIRPTIGYVLLYLVRQYDSGDDLVGLRPDCTTSAFGGSTFSGAVALQECSCGGSAVAQSLAVS